MNGLMKWLFVGAAVLASACGGEATESVSVVRQALSEPGLAPVPCVSNADGSYDVAWDGSDVELMVADAWAECTYWGSSGYTMEPNDGYLNRVRSLVRSTLTTMWEDMVARRGDPDAPVIPDTPEFLRGLSEYWVFLRSSALNCSMAGTGGRTRYRLSKEEHVRYPAASNSLDEEWQKDARRDVRLSGVNACLAQKLRNKSPGASGASALLLTASEQLELLNTVRDRAQLAVHYYTASLGFMNPGVASSPGKGVPYDAQRQAELAVRLNVLSTEERQQWAADWFGSIQLLIATTEELSDLIVRSRSAGLPYPGSADAKTDATRMWGPGSWQKKLAALLYGGDLFTGRSQSFVWEEGADLSPFYNDLRERHTWLLFADTRPLGPEAKELFAIAGSVGTLLYAANDVPDTDILQLRDCFFPDQNRFLLTYEQTQRVLQRRDCGTRVDTSGSPGDEVTPLPFDEATGACGGEVHDILRDRYGVLREHGEALGRHLAAILSVLSDPSALPGSFCRKPRLSALNFHGALDYDAALEAFRLTDNFEFVKPDLAGVSSKFRIAVPVLSARNPHGSAAQHGFPERHAWNIGTTLFTGFESGEQVRRMGTVAVLARTATVVRAVATDLESLGTTAETEFIADVLGILEPDAVVGLIDAAAGKTKVQIQRPVTYTNVAAANPYDFENSTGIDVHLYPSDDEEVIAPQSYSAAMPLYLLFLKQDLAEELAAAPTRARAGNHSIAHLMREAADMKEGVSLCQPAPPYVDGLMRGWKCSLAEVPIAAEPLHNSLTVVAYRGGLQDLPEWNAVDADVASYLEGNVQVIAGSLPDDTSLSWPFSGYETAFGGSLNAFAERQLLPDPAAPYRPAYDGFGLREGWLPPYAPEVVGIAGDTVPISYYIESARIAASSAGEAVRRAMDELTSEVLDSELTRVSDEQRQVAIEASSERARLGLSEAKSMLCGADTNGDCASMEMTMMPLSADWYPSAPTSGDANADCNEAINRAVEILQPSLDGTTFSDVTVPGIAELGYDESVIEEFVAGDWSQLAEGLEAALLAYETIQGYDELNDDVNKAVELSEMQSELAIATMKCQSWKAVESFMNTATRIAQPVREHLNSTAGGVAPLFAAYTGGTIQSALIEQWRALKAPNEKIEYVAQALDAAGLRLKAGNARLVAAGATVRRYCSSAAMARAFAAGFTVSFPGGPSWSPGPLLAQQDRCADATISLGPEIAGARAEMAEATAGVSAGLQGFIAAAAGIQAASASLDALVHQSELASARVLAEQTIESKLARAQFQHVGATSFGLYRMYRDYDLWRARTMVEAARRHALIARKAIEGHFIVDLSELAQDEAFVASPRLWANQIYDYDLSLPAALGLDVPGAGSEVIAVNKIEDYVTNLELFVRGYSVTRPTAVARNEIEVLTLPGPIADESFSHQLATDPPETVTIYPNQGLWQAYCQSTQTWIAIPAGEPNLDTICGAASGGEAGSPSALRLAFWLDPWGRKGGYGPADAPYESRHNGRWDRLAVNLVGTGLLDCSGAVDALGCYGSGYVRYNLEHTGSPWTTDYSGTWWKLEMPSGRIEGAKAVALERWLEPLVDGWNTPYISAATRTEFMNRPLGGEYLLELKLEPQVRAERIQRVQILVGSNYWVAQDGGA